MHRTGKRPSARVWGIADGNVRRAASLLAMILALPTAVAAQSMCLVDTPGAPSCGAPSDPGSHPRTNAAPRYVGNPIDAVGGNKYQREDDFRALGSPLAFSRHYNSALADHDLGLGPGWRHSYQVYLTRLAADTLRIAQSDGRLIEFVADAAAPENRPPRYLSPGERDGHVEVIADSHVWVRPDGRRIAFHGSWPVRFELEGVPSETLTLYYERRRLASVTDAFGRTLRLRYTPDRTGLLDYDEAADIAVPGHLEALLLPGGLEVAIRYDNRANPSIVRYPDASAVTFGYEDRTWPHHLTRRGDTSGERTWRYDEAGRAVAYRDAASGEALDVQRKDADDGRSGEALVRRSRGVESVYRWVVDGAGDGPASADEARVVTIAERLCEDCEESVRLLPVAPEAPHPAASTPRVRPREEDVPATDAAAGTAFSPLPDEPYTLIRVDELGRRVTVRSDSRGNVLDVERDGVSLGGLSDDLFSGALREDGAGVPRTTCVGDATSCLVELGELQDIANEVVRPAVPVTYRAKTPTTGAASRFCTLPNGRTCAELERDRELAELAGCAYATATCLPSYRTVTAMELGLDDELLENKGFSATISQHTTTGDYVVAFRGTDDVRDVREDLMQFAGESTSQYRQAKFLAQELKQLLPGKRITYTGHSLGGGLATVAALTSKDEAVVFNAASLHESTADSLGLTFGDADTYVSNLAVDGEFVTEKQDQPHYPPGYIPPNHDAHLHEPKVANPAPGRRYTLPRPPDAWLVAQKERSSLLLAPESLRLHLMESVLKSIDTVRKVACGA